MCKVNLSPGIKTFSVYLIQFNFINFCLGLFLKNTINQNNLNFLNNNGFYIKKNCKCDEKIIMNLSKYRMSV